MTDTTMADAPQGVVDTTEPVALPDTTAPASGQGDEAGSPATETPAAEPAPAAEAPKEPKAEPWFVKRLDKQKNEIETLRRQLAERGQAAPASAPPQGGENTDDKPLTRADVDRLAAEKASDMARTRAFTDDCNSIAAAGPKAFPDFMTSIGNINMVAGITPDLIDAAREAGDPIKVLYELGKDPDRAAQILALPAHRMGVALAKLAARPAPTTPVSRAPAPLAPVTGSGHAESDPSRMSDDEWYRWSQRQGAKK